MNYSDFSWYKGNLSWLQGSTIFLTKGGSHSYGTNIETSDVDIKGVAIPPLEYFIGFLKKFEQADKAGEATELDYVIFDIRKFFKLASDCNPNIIEFLFVDPGDILVHTKSWIEILDHREEFLSQKAKYTFSGYAVSQLNRIKTHKNWLLHPVENKPERATYGLPLTHTIDKEQLKAFDSRIRKIQDTLGGEGWTKDKVEILDEEIVEKVADEINLNKSIIPIILSERKYAAAMRNYDAYQKWKSERNEKRAELEAKFGYDTKHAMHLVRLMRMAKEILSEGKVLVKRPDAQELLAIRNGAWTYDKLIEWAQSTEKELDEIIKTTKLPHSVNVNKIDDLLTSIVIKHHGIYGT